MSNRSCRILGILDGYWYSFERVKKFEHNNPHCSQVTFEVFWDHIYSWKQKGAWTVDSGDDGYSSLMRKYRE